MRLNRIRSKVNDIKNIKETYSILQKLASINGRDVDNEILDRVMYNAEALPPLGKEYWWFIFFEHSQKGNPVQIMLLIYRKRGKEMLFNGNKMRLGELTKNKFTGVAAGWIYDGETLHDLGDTNTVTDIHPERKVIVTSISNNKITLAGGFPDYRLRIGSIVDLEIRKGNCIEDRYAHGVLIPPFGMGWIDVLLNASGRVFGKGFSGAAHLQKVVGATIYGPFHWGRTVFQNGSSFSFFCLKTGKDSKRYLRRAVNFYDHESKRFIHFKKPGLKIQKNDGKGITWIVKGHDKDKEFETILESYAVKRFDMNGGGSQVYIEYAVVPKSFILKTPERVFTLKGLGRGVGTFEDAYGSPI